MTIAIEKQLRSAGIESARDLINQGSKDAFFKISAQSATKKSTDYQTGRYCDRLP